MRPGHIGDFVARRLKSLREAHGYSIRQLAQRSGITPEMLSRAERAERTPSLETLAKMCAGLNLTVSQFFDEHTFDEPLNWTAAEPGALTHRAQQHFLDALRSLELGLHEATGGSMQPGAPSAAERKR